MFKRIRTPHGNAGVHLAKMWLYFLAASFFVLGFGCGGVQVTGTPVLLGAGVIIGTGGLLGGLLLTIIIRAAFRLRQTGRILQYLCFGIGIGLSISLAEALLFRALLIANPLLTAVAIFALSFGSATLTGQVPVKGRTWLPLPKSGARK